MSIFRLIETVKHLRPKQVVHQIKNRFLKPTLGNEVSPTDSSSVCISPTIAKPRSYEGERFTFLNITSAFENWNMAEYGALWVYNLNYMDWLEQEDISTEECIRWIDKFIGELPGNRIGLAPYPTALRIINWAKFFSKHPECQSKRRNNSMYAQTLLLERKLEYHLLGNHLLEDCYALAIAAIYFCDERLFHKASRLMLQQLEEQILPDGAHYEQSPMYHCIMLDRLLDCINFSDSNALFDGQAAFTTILKEKATVMLGHLQNIIYRDGTIPLMNDSALGIAPIANQLFQYAKRLNISWKPIPLKECGYRKLINGDMEMIVDIGNITASYQPGHSHADTFNFELRINDQPIVVDTAISTYNKNERRQYERSTPAHNTVSVAGQDSSSVWSGFRVGHRAKVTIVKDNTEEIIAQHNGFGKKAIHQRRFSIKEGTVTIEDHIIGPSTHAVGYLHFNPKIQVEIISASEGIIKVGHVCIHVEGGSSISLSKNCVSTEYNQLEACDVAEISFKKQLLTTFSVNNTII